MRKDNDNPRSGQDAESVWAELRRRLSTLGEGMNLVPHPELAGRHPAQARSPHLREPVALHVCLDPLQPV